MDVVRMNTRFRSEADGRMAQGVRADELERWVFFCNRAVQMMARGGGSSRPAAERALAGSVELCVAVGTFSRNAFCLHVMFECISFCGVWIHVILWSVSSAFDNASRAVRGLVLS